MKEKIPSRSNYEFMIMQIPADANEYMQAQPSCASVLSSHLRIVERKL